MMTDKSCKEFLSMLASGAPIPGGGGASAMVGALGTALGAMVGNLTIGRKKYEGVQEDIKNILEKAEKLQYGILDLVEEDGEAFAPLSKAYGLPKNSEEEKVKRDKILEDALAIACSVPLKIMEKALEAIALHEELAVKGTRIAISDVGVGVLFCKSALMGASLNVYINTKLMKKADNAAALNSRAERMLADGISRADKVYGDIENIVKR